MTVTVKSNNRRRNTFLSSQYQGDINDLRRTYDWMDDLEFENARFFKYAGEVYTLADFLRVGYSDLRGWDAILTLSAFDGLLLRVVNNDQVVVGRYYD
jgi:hypothetical protein